MKNILNRLRGKKGTTLAEVLIVLFISSILITIAMGLMRPVQELTKTVKGNAHMDSMCDTVNEYLRDVLQPARQVWVYKHTSTNKSDIKAKAAELKTNCVDLAGRRTTVCAVIIKKDSSGKYRIYDYGTIYRKSTATPPNGIDNLSAFNSAIDGAASEDYNLFLPGYYENLSFELSICGSASNVKISTQCHIGDTDEYANQRRTINFSMVDSGPQFSSEFSEPDPDPSVHLLKDTDGIVILYTRPDFSTGFGVEEPPAAP